MISICIPIFNFDVTALVKELSIQSSRLEVPSEIILIDDCSEHTFKNISNLLCTEHTYIPLKKNIGRAAIRNLFHIHVNYDFLFFLDYDSIISSCDFNKFETLTYFHRKTKFNKKISFCK